jgi:hypothetical protein
LSARVADCGTAEAAGALWGAGGAAVGIQEVARGAGETDLSRVAG